MDIRYSCNQRDFKRYTTEETRKEFLIEELFKADEVTAVYSHVDRMVTLGVMLGLRAETLVPVLIFFGAPTAVSSFPMAQQMDGDGELAASLVVFTSALSILTIFVWVFVLKSLMLI